MFSFRATMIIFMRVTMLFRFVFIVLFFAIRMGMGVSVFRFGMMSALEGAPADASQQGHDDCE